MVRIPPHDDFWSNMANMDHHTSRENASKSIHKGSTLWRVWLNFWITSQWPHMSIVVSRITDNSNCLFNTLSKLPTKNEIKMASITGAFKVESNNDQWISLTKDYQYFDGLVQERGNSLAHYNDVIMSAMASEITNLMSVFAAVYSGTDERKHQSSPSLAFVRGIHRWPVNSPHKGPVMRKMFPFDDRHHVKHVLH